jgi:hypothetical protein
MKEPSMVLKSARHPVNIGQLVMGVAFLGLVAIWALIEGGVVSSGDVRWLLPVPWVFAGLAGLLAATRSGRDWAAGTGSQPLEAQPLEAQPPMPDTTASRATDTEIR